MYWNLSVIMIENSASVKRELMFLVGFSPQHPRVPGEKNSTRGGDREESPPYFVEFSEAARTGPSGRFPLTTSIRRPKLRVWAISVRPTFFSGRGIDQRMSTTFPKKSDLKRNWHVVDADGQILGRLASRVAEILSGKHKPTWVPFLDTGDHVIVVNAEKVLLTGEKEETKAYFQHSGFPGGIRETRAKEIRAQHPERLIEAAVRGMLPKNRLGRAQFRKLKVYRGPRHPHEAQQPAKLEFRTRSVRAR